MTKAWAGAVLLGALTLLPGVHAHGAGEQREIDTRVLLDDDGLVAYGGCVEEQCAGATDGLDLLALDVREAWLGDQPAIVFRMLYQTEGVPEGRGMTLTVSANGTGATFEAASKDGLTFAWAGFDRLDGPFDVFDGFPKALDGWVLLSTLGVAPGDELTGITLASHLGEQPDDDMPGGWYADGVEVPHVPHEPDPGEALEEHGPGTYAVKGPAPLVVVEATPALLDLNRSAEVSVQVTNPLSTLPQAVHVTTPGTLGAFEGGSDAVALTLEPGATRTITLAWPPGAPSGNATVLVTTDLGGRALQGIQVVAAPPPAPLHEDDAPKDGKGIPAAPLAPAALALAAWLWRRR